MNDIKPMDFETWVYASNIEEKHKSFHDEYGDAAGLLSHYKEIHYHDYLEEFMRQLNLAKSKYEENAK